VSNIDRVRYYDGEFLRAFDFGDEQTYHMEMRRRLNRYLHRYGIVQGLQLTEDIEAGIHQVSIPPGMAIDAFGREIYVFAPYTLGDADITANRISSAGPYDVWLRYSKTASTPPSAGYSQCNQANQFTRWLESFSVVLLQSPSNPFTPPAFTDDDTDNPSEDQVGVLLGTVSVDPSSATMQFSGPQLHRRHFLGVVTQSIQTPPGYSAVPAFKFPLKQSARNPPVSLEIEPNIFARQNMILGPDFDLTTTPGGVAIKPTPAFSTSTSGSAKLAGDLFVQGNVYSFLPDPVKPQWMGLQAYVQQLVKQGMPDIAFGNFPVHVVTDNAPVDTPPNGYATKTELVPVQAQRLTSASSYIAFAYFSQVQFDPSVPLTSAPQLTITTPPPANLTFNFTSGQSGQVSVPWKAGPAVGPVAAPSYATSCAVSDFTISCIVFLFP
jgi:hypothetical protein